jgi:YVTN family beta-propeller protein
VEFRILGPLEVEDDGRALSLGGSKQRAVLALLLLHANEVVSRDRLIDDVWGGRAPETAATALQGYVSGLRKALGSERILTRASGYLLQVDPDEVDLRRFERRAREGREALASGDAARASAMLSEALALWHGPPLADLNATPFAYAARLRLEDLRVTAIEEQSEAELALGHHAALVPELEALVREHPLRESLRGQLMLALYRCGRQAEALQVYQEARRLLVGELGLEPGPALRSLEQAILNHDPALELRLPPRRAARTVVSRRGSIAALVALVLAATAAAAAVLLTRTDQPPTVVPNSLVKIDPRTNRVVDVVPVGRNPGKVVAGYGAVWIVNGKDETLTRVGLRSGRASLVGGLRLAAPVGLVAAGGRGLFVGSFAQGEIARINPENLEVAERIRIPGRTATFLAAGAGSLWITQPPPHFHGSVPSAISRISILNNRIQNTFRVPRGVLPGQIAFGAGAAWIANVGDGTVWRIDAATNHIRRIRVGSQPTDVAVGFGSVWVPCLGRNAVWRLDAATGKIQASIPAGKESLALAIGAGAVWITNQAAGTVSRIDPRTNKAVNTIRLGFNPHGLVVADGAVWIAVANELI